jgi:heterodisulfide reductase subunit A
MRGRRVSETAGMRAAAGPGEASGIGEGAGTSGRRIGVYVCHCGGNISDYVDVDRVVSAVRSEPGVVVARTAMFTCSDATQQEIVQDIKEQALDGIVVASCSPKLHTLTFQGVARRAGLNPYCYTQVNVREQCSWAHTDDRDGATDKAIHLVRAGIARTRLSSPLEPVSVETTPKALVIGGGITGLRAAIGLADIGLGVFLVERAPDLGGWVGGFGGMYPHGKIGSELIARLVKEIHNRPAITVFADAEVVSKAGSFGNYQATIRIDHTPAETIQVEVGSVIVATGFDAYEPEAGEFGYGIDGVLTLPEFKRMIDEASGPLTYRGHPVQSIVYVYCVGSRRPAGVQGGNLYCSRYCCAATVHASLQVAAGSAGIRQYHLYRDMRTYGKYELMYAESRAKGALYLRYPDAEPPAVSRDDAGALTVTVRDLLTEGRQLTIPADLIVLVTGMVPRKNDELTGALKLPVGGDGFFNEIHPKLRPVETVVDGVLIAGAAQGPKNSAEAVASGLAAVAQAGAILKKGVAELDPLVATVDPAACAWCGRCVEACPYGAISRVSAKGIDVAVISPTGCKGCGGCVPACPENAIDLLGYTDAQVRAMIDGLVEEAAPR